MSGDVEWEIYYHSADVAGVGRSEFIKLIFEEVGVRYREISDNICELFRDGKWNGYPAFAPPVIKKGDFTLAQTGVICKYLGQYFGLYPENEEDQWHAEQLNASVHDYLAEGRLAFHGVDPFASYFTQQEDTKPYIERFVHKRLPKVLEHFEKALVYNNGGKGFMLGSKITYVDLGVFHILRATENQFPETYDNLATIPLLKAFKSNIEQRPNIAAYLKSPRCNKFQGNSMM